jgi:predicted RNA-binding protein with RPS1 domain
MKNSFDNDSSEKFDDGYETKRTIEEVLDVETGDVIKSEDFFKKPESELISYRRRLQEAIAGYAPPKFVCAYCQQLLKLSGKATRRGEVSFFAHLHDSDDCEIKTNGELTKEEIEIRKYSNIRESKRHIDLKNEIANALKGEASQSLGVQDVEIEKRITSNVPYLYWRQPDISAKFNDKHLIFELQLSTTFLSTIVDRDIFYRLNNTFILWIFNFSDNQERVNLENLMCKDIYYANKRNAFEFDAVAQRMSKEEGQLVLLCTWFEPCVKNEVFNPNKSVRKKKYVRLSDLSFDAETYKPYYIDADSLFFKYQPELKTNRLRTEDFICDKIRKEEKRTREKEHLQKKKQEKIEEIKHKIQQGELKLNSFQKNKKWGYEAGGIEIIEAKYNDVEDFGSNYYAKIKYNKKYGFIDRFGNIVMECDYIEAYEVYNKRCVVKHIDKWYLVDLDNKSKSSLYCYDIRRLYNSTNLLQEINRNTQKVFSGVNRGGYNTYRNQHSDSIYIVSMEGNRIIKYLNYKVLDIKENIILSQIDDYYVCIDIKGNEIKLTKEDIEALAIYVCKDIKGNEIRLTKEDIEALAIKGTSYNVGVVDCNGNTIIPFEYDEIQEFVDNKAKARKFGKYGYIDIKGNELIQNTEEIYDSLLKGEKFGLWGIEDKEGNTIIPFEYDEIGTFIDGKAVSKKSGKYGYIDIKGNTIIPFEYDEIQEFVDNKAKAKKSGKYGYTDIKGNTIIPFEYDWIDTFVNGKAKAKKDNKNLGSNWSSNYVYKEGYIDEQGEIIIPFEYDKIGTFIDGKAKAEKSGKYGYIDIKGITIIPFEYDEIQEFVDNKAKARKSGKYGYIDIKGNELIQNTEEIYDSLIKGEKFGLWGIEDKERNTVVPFVYNEIQEFVDNKAKAKKSGKYGYIDIKGKTIIPFEYDWIDTFVNGKAKAKKDNKNLGSNWSSNYMYKEGYIDEQGEIIIPFEYDKIGTFIDGKAKAEKSGKYGYIDIKGNTIIPFEYDEIQEFVDNKAKARKSRKYGYIDIKGNTIIPFEYDWIDTFVNGKAKAKKDKKKLGSSWSSNYMYKEGYIDEQGEIIIPFEYDEIGTFIDGKAKAKKSGKYGYIDIKGNTIIPFKYDEIQEFVDNKAKARKYRKYGYIDIKGNTIIPFEYDEIGTFIDGKAQARRNRNDGFIDIEGHEVIQNTVEIQNLLFKGEKFGQYGILDKEGQELLPFIYDEIGVIKDNLVLMGSQKIQLYEYKGLKEQPVSCKIEDNADFGLFVKYGKYKGLLHISEITRADKRISDFEKGQNIILYISAVDITKQRFSFSILPSKAKTDKMETRTDINFYIINSIHKGTIVKIVDFGLFVRLESGLTSLLHSSKLRKFNKSISDFEIGEELQVKIISKDIDKNRVSLSLSIN